MSFLFGKKDKKASGRDAGGQGLSPAAVREKEKVASNVPQQNPGGSVNNSLNSIGDQARNRPGEERQYGTRPGTSSGQSNVPNANLYPWSQRQLTFTSSQPNPFPRYGAAVNALASKEGDIYVMGGLVNGQTVKGDLWMVEAGSGSFDCYPVRTEAEGPGPRVGHASLLVGNAFIVFGGDTKQDENDPLDDTLYLLNTSTKQWSRALPPGPRPAGRYGHTLNILGSKLFVFGGQVDGHFFNDLLSFDLNQLQSPANRWELLVSDSADGEGPTGQIPLGRTNHSVITWNDKLYLFGGTDGMQWFNDVWTYDPHDNMWSQLDCIGYIPQPREGHSAALVNDVMYVFGGRTQEGDDLGDLAAFRITSRRWYTFQNMGPSPSPRSGHSMTAYDRQIVVLAGEPSSVQRDPNELSFVYILDTAKIRYPDDQQIQQTPAGEKVSGNRRPSTDRNGSGRGMVPRDAVTGGAPPPASRLPRAASISQPPQGPPPLGPPQGPLQGLSQGPPQGPPPQGPPQGPPPQHQASAPRTNISAIPAPNGPRTRTPTKDPRSYGPSEGSRGPSFERQAPRSDQLSSQAETNQGSALRSISPATNSKIPPPQQLSQMNGSQTQSQVPVSLGVPMRNQPQQQQRHFPKTELLEDDDSDEFEDSAYDQPEVKHSRGPSKDSTRGVQMSDNSQTGKQLSALSKEVEELRNQNARFMSQLGAARKADFVSSGSAGSDLSTRALTDEQKRLLESFTGLKSGFNDSQSAQGGGRLEGLIKKIAELEQQREAAVRDAANSKAQLAAHIDSPSGSPHLGSSNRDLDESEHSQGSSKKLAAAYARHSELEARLNTLDAQYTSEKRAREIAESNADAAHKRALELDQGRNPVEIESLRAELYTAQKEAREGGSRLNDAQAKANMLEIDNEDLKRQLAESTGRFADHGTVLGSLREAVSASEEKYTLLDRKLQQEREDKENIQVKLSQLRTEHEERTAELETTSRRLRDAEELAERHAAEAQKHRNVLVAGLDRLNAKSADNGQNAASDRKIAVLQQQVEDANSRVMNSQAEAERAAERLRSAEERIAGLESYQQQASRDGLTVRKQLQDAIRTAQTFQSQYAEAKSKLESHQRTASALGVQHGALRDIIEERSASATRSLDSPSGIRSPDTARLRELEQMLEESRRAHEESKVSFEITQQTSEKAFRDKLEQLDQDYQSAVSYVKGTEKMLKRMKDELTKSKSQNSRLQADLEKARGGGGASSGSEAPAGWENERQTLQQEIEKMQDSVKTSIYHLEQQMSEIRAELSNAQHERDQFRSQNDHLMMVTQQAQLDIEKLRSEKQVLLNRAEDAENKVALVLDQMEHSVDNYRRQSQMQVNGGGTNHSREPSNTSTYTGGHHSQSNSIGGESYSTTGIDRNSMALDSLASELETLRTQWEGTHRTYRLSNNFDFEREPPNGAGAEMSNSLASWRKRLDAEERDKEGSAGGKGPAAGLRAGGERGTA